MKQASRGDPAREKWLRVFRDLFDYGEAEAAEAGSIGPLEDEGELQGGGGSTSVSMPGDESSTASWRMCKGRVAIITGAAQYFDESEAEPAGYTRIQTRDPDFIIVERMVNRRCYIHHIPWGKIKDLVVFRG